VTEFIKRNPHSWLIMEVRNEDGETERWDIEMGPSMQFTRMQLVFEPGDEVMVVGNPGRNRPRTLHLSGLFRADDDYVMRMNPRTGKRVGPDPRFWATLI
jgi:hypothetical protein